MKTYLTNRIAELRKLAREDGHLQYLFRTREAQRALDRLNEMEADKRLVADEVPQLKARIEGLSKTLLGLENELFARDNEIAALTKHMATVNKLAQELADRKEIVSSTTVVLHRDRDGCIVHSEEVRPSVYGAPMEGEVLNPAQAIPNPYTGL